MPLIDKFGEMWARNTKNIQKIPRSKNGGRGVYILYDGSMPVYIGKGNIHSRIRKAKRSGRRSEFWDYFSWYAIPDSALRHDVEVLLLRRLPWYLRGLNQQSGKFTKAEELIQDEDSPDPITRGRT